jgi:hypothetical protein
MNNVDIPIDINQIDLKDLYKMVFIYNSVMDGWIVKKIDNNKIEMLKNSELVKQYDLDTFIPDIINKYMKV